MASKIKHPQAESILDGLAAHERVKMQINSLIHEKREIEYELKSFALKNCPDALTLNVRKLAQLVR